MLKGMGIAINLLRFVHNDSIMSNLAASAITFLLGFLVGSRWVRRLRNSARNHARRVEEIHALLHHVHTDAARELGHN